MIVRTKIKLSDNQINLLNHLSETEMTSEEGLADKLGHHICWWDVAEELDKIGLVESKLINGCFYFRKYTAEELEEMEV